MSRNQHSNEFRDQALSKVRQRGTRSVRDIAEELNMSVGTLRKWWSRSNRSAVRAAPTAWTYPDLTDTLGLDLHFAAEVNSAVAGMAALALLCISFSKLMGDF